MNTANAIGKKSMQSQRTLSHNDAAEYLGVSVSFLRQARCYGDRVGRTPGPPYVKLGRTVRYLITDLDRYLETHRQGELFYAFGKPFIRVGKTNQVMSPQEQKERLLMGQSETPWTVRAGGPEFQLMLGFKGRELKLGCSFQITAQTQPGGVECRWIGLGTDTDWAKPMKENQTGKYQMKEIMVNPDMNLKDNIITLEIRFWLEDGKEHGGRWMWPLKPRGDGVWELKQELGSHVFQPRDSDWW